MVFLVETKVTGKTMELIRRCFGYVHDVDVSALGSKGGLCLAWKEEVHVEV